MTSLIRTIRDWMHGIPKDASLEYSQITDDLYIGAWPTKYNVDTIQSLGITLILSTILESVDKELGQPPLRLVKMRMSDALPNRPYYPTKTLMRGVNAAVAAFDNGEKVMVFCKSGRHRSVTTACCILVGQGYGAEEAISLVESKRPQADLNDALRKRIKTFEQAWLEQSSRNSSE
jgi:protein-tyrosine phosphatase